MKFLLALHELSRKDKLGILRLYMKGLKDKNKLKKELAILRKPIFISKIK